MSLVLSLSPLDNLPLPLLILRLLLQILVIKLCYLPSEAMAACLFANNKA
ncbi:hypothetical protein Patl1_11112 [Pistacia atlantica]|uniref:Uncharacterized protein n=1 Tax=Pistacia atlantica TaxID=434234 RepID=A0ACC1A711_9ROSI|nr:hypothetical protein Patl1_11112 [Pistacia atlantica]